MSLERSLSRHQEADAKKAYRKAAIKGQKAKCLTCKLVTTCKRRRIGCDLYVEQK